MSEKEKETQLPDFENRRCRDALCAIFFWVVMAGMVVIMGIAYSEGDYRRLTNGMDYRGCTCGITSYYDQSTQTCDINAPVNASVPSLTLGALSVFVEMHPEDGQLDSGTVVVYCADTCATHDAIICSNEDGTYYPEGANVAEQLQTLCGSDSTCAAYDDNCGLTVAASSHLGYCVPSANSTFVQAASAVMDNNAWSEAMSSIEKSSTILVVTILIALVLSFVYLKLLEYFAKAVTVAAMFGVGIAVALCGWFCYDYSQTLKESYTGENANGYTDDLNWQLSFYGGIIIWGVTVLYLFFVCFMWKRVMLAVDCLNLASDALQAAPTLVFVPTIASILTMGVFAWWLVTAVFLFSTGEVTAVTPTPSGFPEGLVKTVSMDDTLQGTFLYHLFGGFWVVQLFVAISELAIALVVARWYFTPAVAGKREMPGNPVLWSVSKVFKWHFGSVAFGSLIIAIVQTIRAVVEYLDYQRKKYGKDSKLITYACCCLKCCLWCIEKCLRFINRVAYINIAITGASFCEACSRAFGLILRNVARVGALKMVSSLFILLGKMLVSSGSAFICFTILTQVSTYSDPALDTAVPNAFIPAGLAFVVAYAIASMVMNVLSTAIDTVMFCFIHDCEVHDGTPRFAGDELADHVDRMNKNAEKAGVRHPADDKAFDDGADAARA